MHRILRDFYLAELRGLLPLLAAIALLLGYLILRGPFPVQAILFCPPLAVLASLRAWLSSTAFRNAFETLPLARQEHIAREYTQPHPAVPMYQGEAHLLSDCLLCRSRRTLLLLPSETLAYAKFVHYGGRNRAVSALLLTGLDGKSFRLEFLAGQKKGLAAFADVLAAWDVPIEGCATVE